MSQQTFAEMSEAEFDTLIDNYIDREANRYGEMPAEIFFDLLLERTRAKIEKTLNLEIEVVDDRLVITPDRKAGDVVIHENEILVGGHRLVFELTEATQLKDENL